MSDIIFTEQMISNMKILADRGILEPLAELIEKLHLNEEDMIILNKLINNKLKDN